MSKSKELKTTSEIVKTILEQNPQSRNSDDFLYIKVCEKVNDISINLPFKQVMANRKLYGLPPFESVRRCRQKIQATHPELSGDSNVEAQRMLNEETFRDYARKGAV